MCGNSSRLHKIQCTRGCGSRPRAKTCRKLSCTAQLDGAALKALFKRRIFRSFTVSIARSIRRGGTRRRSRRCMLTPISRSFFSSLLRFFGSLLRKQVCFLSCLRGKFSGLGWIVMEASLNLFRQFSKINFTDIPDLIMSTMPSGSTRLTFAFLYSSCGVLLAVSSDNDKTRKLHCPVTPKPHLTNFSEPQNVTILGLPQTPSRLHIVGRTAAGTKCWGFGPACWAPCGGSWLFFTLRWYKMNLSGRR
jgi:hypothetical protein